jgi:hypothetical protein
VRGQRRRRMRGGRTEEGDFSPIPLTHGAY